MPNRNRLVTREIPLGVLCGWVCCLPLMAQPSLQITSPPNGAVISSGQTLGITVSATGAFQQVIIVGQNPLGTSQSLNATLYQFQLLIPAGIPAGSYSLTAVGALAPGQPVYSDPMSIDIEPASAPTSLSVGPAVIDLSVIGDQVPLEVVGTFSDGSTVWMTNSSTIAYSSDTPSVASVDTNGIVTAIAPGTALVSANGRNVPVTVRPPVVIVPSNPVSLFPSQSRQYFARVRNNSNNTAVTWSIAPSGIGTITPTGPASVVYQAPAIVSSPQTLILTATSVDDPTQTWSAAVFLIPAVSTPVAAPTFGPGGGTYSTAQTVTLSSATAGATIRYTTDGTTPSETAGTVYSGPLTVSATTTVKAVAYASGFTDSAVARRILHPLWQRPRPSVPAAALQHGADGHDQQRHGRGRHPLHHRRHQPQ